MACKAKDGNCAKCGWCCVIRRNMSLASHDEARVKKALYANTGVIYLYPFSRLSISLTPEDRAIIEAEASRLGMELSILPKRITLSRDRKATVLDWFIDADQCPFLKGKAECLIYAKRPSICRMFPDIPSSDKIQYNKPLDVPYRELVVIAKRSLKKQDIPF